jgi:putative ABC transport system permease protein
MSFLTALSLSFRNLFTKKARTLMVSIASSIGIIGVCLVLALSNGLNNYIAKLQSDTISSSPITITQQVANMQAMSSIRNDKKWQKFPNAEKIFVEESVKMQDFMKKNVITQDYIDYINQNIKSELINDVMYKNGVALNLYTIAKGNSSYTKVSLTTSSNPLEAFMGSGGAWQQMPKTEFVKSQYKIIKGDFPTDKTQVLLVVDEYNRVKDDDLIRLGLKDVVDESTEIDFDEVMYHKYKIATNNQAYEYVDNNFQSISAQNIDMAGLETLEIVGIARLDNETVGGTLSTGIAYLPSLTDWLLQENLQSEIVSFMNNNPDINPTTGENYLPTATSSVKEQQEKNIIKFGANVLPNEINIYAVDIESKDEIKSILDNYNKDKTEDDMILYSDLSETIGMMFGGMVNTITYVLVGFSAVSLLVSSIMISILTYVSVIERTKEIGVLRSIGARKKDITRVFNAETFILGGFAGIIGVCVTLLLSIPINSLLSKLADVKNIASLSISTGGIMLLVSILLSVISGFLPSKKAAKKDPVLALRTE